MVKAKFGALALTVLMGLGAVSPLHGVTEAHALNAPVANSAQQKTVVSTTDDSDGVMSYKDKESGKTFVSEDNGASWMSEEDYNNSHPAINYEWWTYDEYFQKWGRYTALYPRRCPNVQSRTPCPYGISLRSCLSHRPQAG